MSTYEEKAKELFQSGCNCAQAVFCAFSEICGIDEKTALRLSSSFGGGFGRLREICGAVSGMGMVLGCLYGYDDITDPEAKKEHYERIRACAAKFEEEFGSIICRDLLEDAEKGGSPEARTPEYYRKRSCADYVAIAARIAEEYIKENK